MLMHNCNEIDELLTNKKTKKCSSESFGEELYNAKYLTIYPPGYEIQPLAIQDKYKFLEFPFELDIFQKLALSVLHINDNVIVSAHTSSGKTAIGEYAIAMSLANGNKVIYTCPIKALSNQKYRELSKRFGDVGLITGDLTVNTSANCLVMTTEILRNMIYRKNQILESVAWIIFDEVHYIKDKERGVVWEECIILAQLNIRMVFLSATVPNADEFAEWVCEVRARKVHVISTDKRPTSLEHYLYIKLYDRPVKFSHDKVIKEKINSQKNSEMLKHNSIKYRSEIEGGNECKDKDKITSKYATHESVNFFDDRLFSLAVNFTGMNGRIDITDIENVINYIKEKNLLPAIIFTFSKMKLEKYARSVSDRCPYLLDNEEKLEVKKVFAEITNKLSEDTQKMPHLIHLLTMACNGIGIHHSGLLSLAKDFIEILFQKKLIKILFATETFSMGLKMPAQCVVFSDVEKYDGDKKRFLTPGEYIQMSGRAGRRGIDEKGVVISLVNRRLGYTRGKNLFSGSSDRLTSAFKYDFKMILNLVNSDIIQFFHQTFIHYQNKKNLYKKIERLKKMEHNIYMIKLNRKRKKQELKQNGQKKNFFKTGKRVFEMGNLVKSETMNKIENIELEKMNVTEVHNLVR